MIQQKIRYKHFRFSDQRLMRWDRTKVVEFLDPSAWTADDRAAVITRMNSFIRLIRDHGEEMFMELIFENPDVLEVETGTVRDNWMLMWFVWEILKENPAFDWFESVPSP